MPYDTRWITDRISSVPSTAEAMPDPVLPPRLSRRLDRENEWVVIPARRGSRGVVDKNVRPLGSMSLLDRAANVALQLGHRAIITTDYPPDHEYVRHQAHWCHPRPPHLATDTTPIWAVLSHLYAELHWHDNDMIVLLQPTSLHPTRAEVVRAMLNSGAVPSCTVDRYPDRWHPWYAQDAQQPHQPPACRQGLPPRFRPNGLVYLLSGATARRESFWADHPTFYEMAPGAVLNIDTPDDWAEAERQYGHV